MQPAKPRLRINSEDVDVGPPSIVSDVISSPLALARDSDTENDYDNDSEAGYTSIDIGQAKALTQSLLEDFEIEFDSGAITTV